MAEKKDDKEESKIELPYSPEDFSGGERTQEFIINSLIGKIGTITIGKIVKVKGGKTGAVGTVDIQPMVLQVDGAGNPIESAVIFNVPYMRYQGGDNAIIIDPKAGDIGICLISSRDISMVKATKKMSPPASKRQYDMSDSLYIGGILNGMPSQYIYLSDGGIDIVSGGTVNISGSKITLDAPVFATSTIDAAGPVNDNTGG